MSRLTDDAALEALAKGELDDDELGLLRALAEEDPEAQAELEAARPLDEAARARIADGLAASFDGSADERRGSGSPRAASGRRPWVLGATAVALAAAVALVVVPRALEPALPDFALEVSGQQSQSRSRPSAGSVDAPVTLAPEGTLSLVLRPEEAVAVEGALYVERDGELAAVAVRPEAAPNGTLRWRVPASTLGSVGELTLVVAYGAEAPTPAAVRAHLAEGDPRARRVHLELAGADP